MEEHIESIRSAFADGASTEVRERGAAACRALLVTLEPVPESTTPLGAEPPLAQIAENALALLRRVPPEKLLDLAINTLRAKLPAGTQLPAARPLAFQMLPVPVRR